MLPERLSNGLCSLRPKEEKLCFSAVFELDENAFIKPNGMVKPSSTQTGASPMRKFRK
jgi:exoribonuclease II